MNDPKSALPRYKKATDVQQTWREHGWRPPSEDMAVQSKWHFYRTLSTERVLKEQDPK